MRKAGVNTKAVYKVYTHHAVETPENGCRRLAFLSNYQLINMPGDTGAFENNCWTAGGCVVQQLAVDGNTQIRTEEHTQTSQNLLHVHRYLSGGADGKCGSVPYTNRPRSIVIHDYARPFEALQTTSVLQSLHIPVASPFQ